MNKRCIDCGADKPVTAFYLTRGRPRQACKPCWKTRTRSRGQQTGWSRWQRLGIDRATVEAGYKNREGRCDICQEVHPTLCVDHDHYSGEIRGMLCSGCNKALGLMKDDVERLRRAMVYLRNNP